MEAKSGTLPWPPDATRSAGQRPPPPPHASPAAPPAPHCLFNSCLRGFVLQVPSTWGALAALRGLLSCVLHVSTKCHYMERRAWWGLTVPSSPFLCVIPCFSGGTGLATVYLTCSHVHVCVHGCGGCTCTCVYVCTCVRVASGTPSTESSGNSTRPLLIPLDIFHKLGLRGRPPSAHPNHYFHVFTYRTLTRSRHPSGRPVLGSPGGTLPGEGRLCSSMWGSQARGGTAVPGSQAQTRAVRLLRTTRPRAGWQAPEAGHRAGVKEDAQEPCPHSIPTRFLGPSWPGAGRPRYCHLCALTEALQVGESHFLLPSVELVYVEPQLLRAFQTVMGGPVALRKVGGCLGGSCVNAPILGFRDPSRAQLRAFAISTHPSTQVPKPNPEFKTISMRVVHGSLFCSPGSRHGNFDCSARPVWMSVSVWTWLYSGRPLGSQEHGRRLKVVFADST